MTSWPVPTAVIYFTLMPVALIAGIVVEYVAITAANALPRWFLGEWTIIPLNFFPAAVAGFFIYRAPAEQARDGAPSTGWHEHFLRAAPLYVAIVLLGIWIAPWVREPGFGLVAQLCGWPLAAFLGGICADLGAGRGGRPSQGRNGRGYRDRPFIGTRRSNAD